MASYHSAPNLTGCREFEGLVQIVVGSLSPRYLQSPHETSDLMDPSQMRQPTHDTAKLPQKLLDELGVSVENGGEGSKKRNRILPRRERRKAERIQKKSRVLPSRERQHNPRVQQQHLGEFRRGIERVDISPPVLVRAQQTTVLKQQKPIKSVLKKVKSQESSQPNTREQEKLSQTPPLRPKVSQGTKEKLLADDAEIAALEKALGLKKSGTLTRAFQDDGLDELLDGLGDAHGEDRLLAKRKRAEGEEWLEKKRRMAHDNSSDLVSRQRAFPATDDEGLHEDLSGDSDTKEDLSGSKNSEDSKDGKSIGSSFSSQELGQLVPKPPRARENPYKPPVIYSIAGEPSKYIPPSLRVGEPSLTEDLIPLRRQLQGLLNRLSEANLISILGDVERVFQNNARQHVSTVVLDLLMGQVCDPTSLPDTFIILYGGFIAAVYKIIGNEFGAQVIQRIDKQFAQHYSYEVNSDSTSKRCTNLMSLLAEMYNFQVITSNLIYDYIRLFLEDLTETSAELVLKIVRNSGPQLRLDDASSLKDIVLLLQASSARKGVENLSVRTKFMIETINNLKNNRMKTGIAASTIASEHTIRMKKTLGSLNMRSIRAGEALRIGLKDLRESDKRGKWWLVGASYKDEGQNNAVEEATSKMNVRSKDARTEVMMTVDASTDLVQLAREQRMNTDVRRSIFIAIMSATDYKDAYLRLQKVRLKKAQELEIPKVLIHCAAAEKAFNPFYSLLAKRLCSDRKLKMAFQFSLWDLFKRMGEGQDGSEEENSDEHDEDSANKLSLRSLVNLAKLYGTLISDGGLTVSVLKHLNFAYLRPKTKTFVELLFITIILNSQGDSAEDDKDKNREKDEQSIIELFLGCEDTPGLATGLQYFMKKVVSKTDVAGTKVDRETVKWGCKVAQSALRALTSNTVAGG